MSRLSYVVFCGLSPRGNWYIRSEPSQERARAITSHPAILWGCFATSEGQPLHKHRRSNSRSRCWSSSCVESCVRIAVWSCPSAESADTGPQRLPYSRSNFVLVCRPEHREVRISHNYFVYGWGLLYPGRGFHFINHNNHTWAEETFAINACGSIALLLDFLNGSYLLPLRLTAYIYWARLEEVLQKLLGNIPLGIRRDMWLHDDEAASPFTRHVRKLLTATYSGHWIRQGGLVAWLLS